MLVFKFLNDVGLSPYQRFEWPLPTQNDDETWIPGEWTKPVEQLEMCGSGYHFARPDGLLDWGDYTKILYVGEVQGETLTSDHEKKIVAQSGRILYPVTKWNSVDDQALMRVAREYGQRARSTMRNGRRLMDQVIAEITRLLDGGEQDPLFRSNIALSSERYKFPQADRNLLATIMNMIYPIWRKYPSSDTRLDHFGKRVMDLGAYRQEQYILKLVAILRELGYPNEADELLSRVPLKKAA